MANLVLAADLMRSDVEPLTPLDTLDRALELFVQNDLLTLPVVTSLADRLVVGTMSRFDISSGICVMCMGLRTVLKKILSKQ